MPPHLIHVIDGSTGAGKTTYAMKLCEQLRGVRFSIDEWMTNLFWMDSPQPLVPGWALARVERCFVQIWATASQAASAGIPCVLDCPVGDRLQFASRAGEAGLTVQLHFLDVPEEERWRRVERRNAEKGKTYQLDFDVTREMFDYVESRWVPPTESEMAALHGVRILGD